MAFAKQNPKTDVGRKVFYTLIHYYVRANFSNITWEDYNWVNQKITDILNEDNNTRAAYIQLEYILVLWVLSKLERYRSYKNKDALYGKTFAHNETVRSAVLRLICAGKRNWRYYLANQEAHDAVTKNFTGKQGGDDVIAIIHICFPLKEDIPSMDSPQLQEPIRYEPIGYDKEFTGVNLNEAWAELNKLFNEQQEQRKNN